MSRRLPWSKFRWDEYENDVNLMMCSFEAQGLWMRLLCLMTRMEPYGHLVVAGKPVSPAQIAAITAKPAEIIKPLMKELEAGKIFSRTDAGIIYSRRLVRDQQDYEQAREYGSKGGNPNVKKATYGKRKQRSKGGLTHTANLRQQKDEGKPVTESSVAEENQGANTPLTQKEEGRRKKEEVESLPTGVSLGDGVAPQADILSRSAVVPFKVVPAQEAFDAWNDVAKQLGLSQALVLNDHRRRRLAARLKECDGLPGWMLVLDQVRQSPALCGGGGSTWRCDLDWLLRPDRFHQVREGACKGWGARQAASSSGHEWMAGIFAGPGHLNEPDQPSEQDFQGETINGQAETA